MNEIGMGRTAAKSLRPREAAVFASLTEAYCRPEPAFPRLAMTDTVAFIDAFGARSRRLNRIGFRVILWVVELAPLVRGYGATFTRLAADRQAQFVRGLDRSRWQLLQVGFRLLKTLAVMSYYGDAGVLRAIGYDAEANVARGRALRRSEGRP
jgi:hypothetical protein